MMSITTRNDTDNSFIIDYGLKLVIKHSPNHITHKIKIRKFLKLHMKRWKFNRPKSIERVQEIAQSLLHKREPVSYLFYCTYSKDTQFEIIDGIHRYYALKSLAEILEDVEMNSWFYESYLLIETKTHHTQGQLIDWFQSINNSIPVSDLYLKADDDEKKEIIEEVVKTYYDKYKIHFKGSKPNIPNTSTEKFTELLSYIYDTFDVSFENKRMIINILEDINNYIQSSSNIKRLNKKISDASLDKCKRTGLYLFLVTKEKMYELILNYKLE